MAKNFSIITPTFNSIKFLPDCYESVQSQQNVSLEHLFIDGMSNDGTINFFDEYNVTYISEKDSGIYEALNKGMKIATGDYIGILHSDDLFSDEYVLRDVLGLFEAGADVVYADLQYVSRNNTQRVIREWRSGPYHPTNLLFGWMPPHPTFFFRRVLLEEIGEYNINFNISADYEFMLRFLSKEGLQVSYIPRAITKMRVGGVSNRNLRNILKKSHEDYLIMQSFSTCPLGTLVLKNVRKIGQFRVFSPLK